MALPPIAVTEVALSGISRYYNISGFSMLFVMVFRRYPEKFSFGIFFPLQNPILFAYTDFQRIIELL